jgi:hypothetical protein
MLILDEFPKGKDMSIGQSMCIYVCEHMRLGRPWPENGPKRHKRRRSVNIFWTFDQVGQFP